MKTLKANKWNELQRVILSIGAKTTILRSFLTNTDKDKTLFKTALSLQSHPPSVDKYALLLKLTHTVFTAATSEDGQSKQKLDLIKNDLDIRSSIADGVSFFEFCLQCRWREHQDAEYSVLFCDIYDMSRDMTQMVIDMLDDKLYNDMPVDDNIQKQWVKDRITSFRMNKRKRPM